MKRKFAYLVVVTFLCFITNLSFCQNEPTISCNLLPPKPIPATAVNDFANIIDDGAQQAMENRIRNYWDNTSIALVVVTVQNMNGNEVEEYALSLFRCWGIGGKGSNRGILLLVSMDEHKIWIATGYGIEGILTDVTCTEIAEETIKPLCKEGKYSEAVVAGVDKIFQTLGTMTWEERMEGINAEKSASDKKWRDTKETILHISLLAALIVLFYWLYRVIAKGIKQDKLRKELVGIIAKIQVEIKKAYHMIGTSLDEYKDQPSWAQQEAENHKTTAYESLSKAQNAISEADDQYQKQPEKAQQRIEEAKQMIEKSFENFSRINNSLKEKIKKISNEAPIRLESAQEQVSKNLGILMAYANKGYKFLIAISEQESYKKLLDQLKEKIEITEFHQQIYSESEIISAKSKASIESVLQVVQAKESIDTNIYPLIAIGKECYKTGIQTIHLFTKYKLKYPESVWQAEEVRLTKLIGKLDLERLDKQYTEIVLLNSMEKQEFSIAATKYNELQQQVSEIKELCTKVQNIAIEQEKSRGLYASSYSKAEASVHTALQKTKDSDVKSVTKTMAKDVQRKLQDISVSASTVIVDWVSLIQMTANVISVSDDAVRKAQQDIRNAENERDEERRRKRRAEENAQRSTSNNYSSSYTSNNSSGSFGGLSGGDTGGGGGGATW